MRIIDTISSRPISIPQERRNALLTRKSRAIVCIGIVGFSSLIFLEGLATSSQRRLNCRTISDFDQGSVIGPDGEESRNLGPSFTMFDRLLQLGAVEDPCITSFPVTAQETVLAADSPVALAEPTFAIVPADDDAVFGFLSDDTVINIVPETVGDTVLDAAERDLVQSYEPVTYDPVVAEAKATTNDADTIAYVVSITGCPEWYEPGSEVGIADAPIIANDLYEASAILKSEVCEMTEQAEIARRLGHTRKLVQLGDQLSAAEMNYTM